MGQSLFAIGSMMSVGGQVYGAQAGLKESGRAAAMLEMQGREDIYAAAEEKEATYKEQLQLLRRGRAIKGQQVARAAVSGATVESFLPVLIEAAEELELERHYAKERGQARERQFRHRAMLRFMEAKGTRKRGRSAFYAGLLGAAGSAAGSYYQYKTMWPSKAKTVGSTAHIGGYRPASGYGMK